MFDACVASPTKAAWPNDYDAIWHVDFEYRQDGNHLPIPVCMTAREQHTGALIQLWRNQLLQYRRAPFDVGPRSLMVAFSANAELSCFLALGWPFPCNVLDLYVENIAAINGDTGVWSQKKRPGLLPTLGLYGLEDGISTAEKHDMRDVILGNVEYTEQQRRDILAYNLTDVEATLALIKIMAPSIDLPRALLRGRYMGADAQMTRAGIPVDRSRLAAFVENLDDIKRYYIHRDDDFGLYDDISFREARLEQLISDRGWDWPRTAHGHPETKAETFGRQARRYPELKRTASLYQLINNLRVNSLANTVGEDGRSRCSLMPFWTKTGRNQPQERDKVFLPALPAYLHGLIKPAMGEGAAELDWSAQEVAIMAALSGDKAMIADYESGEPYLAFAKRAKLAPENATKVSHRELRNKCCKPVVLGMNYGMTPYGIAAKTGKSLVWARDIHARHRQVYPVFTKWLAHVVAQAKFDQVIYSPFGWPQAVPGGVNDRSIMNFPAQASGADMMRIAAIAATEGGISVAAPIHDAFWITAALSDIDADTERMTKSMRCAGQAVTGGLEVGVTVESIVRWPQSLGDVRSPEDRGQVYKFLFDLTDGGNWLVDVHASS